MCSFLSCALYWGPSPQPRPVPWLGIEPATVWLSGQHSPTEPHQSGLLFDFFNHVHILLGFLPKTNIILSEMSVTDLEDMTRSQRCKGLGAETASGPPGRGAQGPLPRLGGRPEAPCLQSRQLAAPGGPVGPSSLP